jgi:hypothetical protein
MMLDGTLCQCCGEYLGADDEGFPQSCAGCSKGDDDTDSAPRAKTEAQLEARRRRRRNNRINRRKRQEAAIALNEEIKNALLEAITSANFDATVTPDEIVKSLEKSGLKIVKVQDVG